MINDVEKNDKMVIDNDTEVTMDAVDQNETTENETTENENGTKMRLMGASNGASSSDIDGYLEQIRTAVYGEEMRTAITGGMTVLSGMVKGSVITDQQNYTNEQKVIARNNIDAANETDVNNKFDAVSTNTKNLWPLATTPEFTTSLTVPLKLNAGTYTISTSSIVTNSGKNSVRIQFYGQGDTQLNVTDESTTTPSTKTYLSINISQNKRIFTLEAACIYAIIFAGDTAGSSLNKVATWNNVQVESGRTATEYISPFTALDRDARSRLTVLEDMKSMDGKTIVCFGDSIFGNYVAPNDIPSFMSKYTGANVINVGFGGTRMTDNSAYGNKGYFSMCKLAEAIVANDFSQQEGVLSSIADDRYTANLNKLKNIDFNNVDIITMEHATNDWYGNTNLTSETVTGNLVYSNALEYVINTLMTAFPKIRIVIISPIYRRLSADSDSNTYTNTKGNTLKDYVAKMKEIAESHNLYFINDYNIGINSYNHAQFLEDGTHPTEAGRQLIASHIVKELF